MIKVGLKLKTLVSFILICLTVSSFAGDSMVKQNQEIDNLKLPRIVDDSQLKQLISQNELVKLPENVHIRIEEHVKPLHKYVRPWTRNFVIFMADSFYSDNHQLLIIDSAVRTVEQQASLVKTNRFAAPAYGEITSSHLAGITVDIQKRKYTTKQRRWIVEYLKIMQTQGFVVFSEEPYCYHVAVLEKFNEVNLWMDMN